MRSRRTGRQVALATVALTTLAAVLGPAGRASADGTPHLAIRDAYQLAGVPRTMAFSAYPPISTTAAPRPLVLSNVGDAPLTVTGWQVTGPQASSFLVPPIEGTLCACGDEPVPTYISFRPPAGSPYRQHATLMFQTNDPRHPVVTVQLNGLHLAGTGGTNEPPLRDVLAAVGLGTSPGPTGSKYVGRTRVPRGDERISPYWQAANPERAVWLQPIARFGPRVVNNGSRDFLSMGYRQRGLSVGHSLDVVYPDSTDPHYWGPYNQSLFPPAWAGARRTFAPAGPFSLVGEGRWPNDGTDQLLGGYSSDDGLNPGKVHAWRFYRLRDLNRRALSDTDWVAVYESQQNAPHQNWDYQDWVYVLHNVRPVLTQAPAPSAAGLNLDFSTARPGTVPDKDGQGTGFNSTESVGASSGLNPAYLDLRPAAGRLVMRARNYPVNALQEHFNAARYSAQATVRIVDVADIAGGSGTEPDNTPQPTRVGVFFGPDAANSALLHLAAWPTGLDFTMTGQSEAFAGHPAVYTVTQAGHLIPLADVHSVDLRLLLDLPAGTITGQYRVNSASLTSTAPWTTVGTFSPPDVTRWFSTQARAGVRNTYEWSSQGLVTIDAFRIAPARS